MSSFSQCKRVKGRPHYYSSKKEEYAIIKFSLDADLSSLFTWNTKQVFVYVTADWPPTAYANATNSAVIWDAIITNPSADHLKNIGPVAMKKLRKSAEGKVIDPSRYVTTPFLEIIFSCFFVCFCCCFTGRSRGLLVEWERPTYIHTHAHTKTASIPMTVAAC